MFTSQLSKRERKLVRKIVKLQLKSIRSIIEDNCEEVDFTMFCIEHELTKEEVIEIAMINHGKYEKVLMTPNLLLTLDPDNLSIVKHIMFNYFRHPKYQDAKRDLWRKFFTAERTLRYTQYN